METPFQIHSYSNYVQLIKVALRHAPISSQEPSLLCVVIITASIKLSYEIFTVYHSPYSVSKFKPRPSECGENGWKHFWG